MQSDLGEPVRAWEHGDLGSARISDVDAWYNEPHAPLVFPLAPHAFRRQASESSGRRRRYPLNRSSREVAELFESLAQEWKSDTKFESIHENMILHSSYQRIIGLGPDALPYILRDLRVDGEHWFWALTAIVGEDKASGCSSIEEATEAWLTWAAEVGLIVE